MLPHNEDIQHLGILSDNEKLDITSINSHAYTKKSHLSASKTTISDESCHVANYFSITQAAMIIIDSITCNEEKCGSKCKNLCDGSAKNISLTENCLNSTSQIPSRQMNTFTICTEATKLPDVQQETKVLDTPMKRRHAISNEDLDSEPHSKKHNASLKFNHNVENYTEICSTDSNLQVIPEITIAEKFLNESDRITTMESKGTNFPLMHKMSRFEPIVEVGPLSKMEANHEISNSNPITEFERNSTALFDDNKEPEFKIPIQTARKRAKSVKNKVVGKNGNKPNGIKNSECNAAEKVEFEQSQIKKEIYENIPSSTTKLNNETYLHAALERDLNDPCFNAFFESLANKQQDEYQNSLAADAKRTENFISQRFELLEQHIHYFYNELHAMPSWSPKLKTMLRHLAKRRPLKTCVYLAERYNSECRRPLSRIREEFTDILDTLGSGMIDMFEDVRYAFTEGNIQRDHTMIDNITSFWDKIEKDYNGLRLDFYNIRADYPNYEYVCESMDEHFSNLRQIFFIFQESIIDLFESF